MTLALTRPWEMGRLPPEALNGEIARASSEMSRTIWPGL